MVDGDGVGGGLWGGGDDDVGVLVEFDGVVVDCVVGGYVFDFLSV